MQKTKPRPVNQLPHGPTGPEGAAQRLEALRVAADEAGLSADAVKGDDRGPALLRLVDEEGFEVVIQAGVFFAFCHLAQAASAVSEAHKNLLHCQEAADKLVAGVGRSHEEDAAYDKVIDKVRTAKRALVKRLETLPDALETVKVSFNIP